MLFSNTFITSPGLYLINDFIPNLVNEDRNNMLTKIPNGTKIKQSIFSLNKEGAPGPDGFGAFLFHTYWDIIKLNVIEVVKQFFMTSQILPNFNAN